MKDLFECLKHYVKYLDAPLDTITHIMNSVCPKIAGLAKQACIGSGMIQCKVSFLTKAS